MVSGDQRRAAADGWIILRTSGARTLRLRDSLEEDGFDVWTPTRVRTVRVPRANFRRPVKFAVVPSFVFARRRHLYDLLELAAMPDKPRRGAGLRKPAHDPFSVFRHCDRIPVIRDEALESLRQAEERVTDKRPRRYGDGERVKILRGPFGGMIGRVEKSSRRKTVLCFGHNFRVEVDNFILGPEDVADATS